MPGKAGILLKTAEQIAIIRENGDLLGRVHGLIAEHVAPGVTTSALDKLAAEFLRDHGAKGSFLGFNGFPATLCVSVNEVVVHGIPGAYTLQDGDIISVDCGVHRNGFHADSAYTHMVGTVRPEVKELLRVTLEALHLGIEQVEVGKRMGDMSHAIQSHCEAHGYTVVRELIGHGIGTSLHEAPEVPNYGKRGKGIAFQDGMVLAIEPMINLGSRNIRQERDGWTIRTADRKPSAHFEHTVAVWQGKPEILTTFKYIEEVRRTKYGQASIY